MNYAASPNYRVHTPTSARRLSSASAKLGWPELLVALLVVGYLCMSRSFAHLGVSPLYIGELSLALLLAGCSGVALLWYRSLVAPGEISSVAWLYLIFAAYGLLQSLHGFGEGYRPMLVLQCLAFNLYPMFFFAGVYAGVRQSDLLPRLIRIIAWCHGFYGLLYIGLLSPAGLTASVETEDVGLFGQPYGAAVVLLGLIAYEQRLMRVWMPLLLNTFVLLALQVRAAWLGFALALPMMALMTGRMAQLCKVLIVLGGLLVVGLITDFKLPAPKSRGGEISTRSLIGRAVSAFDSKAALQYTDDADSFGGTVSWRTGWWEAIWQMVHRTPTRAVLGAGYGYPIWDLHPEDLGGEMLRTPHNNFFFALCYTGWLGVALFYSLLLAIAGVLWKVYRHTGQAFGFCYWAMIVAWSFFDNFFEAPYGAIPFFLITGMAAAPLVRARLEQEQSASLPSAIALRTSPAGGGA